MKIPRLLAILVLVLAGRSPGASAMDRRADGQPPAIAASDGNCSFTLNSTTAHFTTAGGSSNVTVTTSDTNCSWTATSYSSFIRITSATNFTGDGVVTYGVLGNTNAVAFTGVMIIAGQTYLVTQDGFAVARGTFNGVMIDSNAPSATTSGSAGFVLKNTGKFRAKLNIGNVPSSFKGAFDGAGTSTNVVPNSQLGALHIIMQLDVFEGANNITGTVSNDAFTSSLMAGVASIDRTNRCPVEGQYTVVLAPADTGDLSVPQGYGYGTLTVRRNGTTSFQGVLGDGTRLAIHVPGSPDGSWPLYQQLYKKQGSCVGSVVLLSNNTFSATVDWFKPAGTRGPFYLSGFTTAVGLAGSRFVSPFAGGPTVAGSGTLTLGGGNLQSNIVKSVLVDTNGNVTVSPPDSDKVALGIDPSTGQFGGSFIDTAIGRKFDFTGLLIQTNTFGAGFFLETNRSGFVTIQLTP